MLGLPDENGRCPSIDQNAIYEVSWKALLKAFSKGDFLPAVHDGVLIGSGYEVDMQLLK